VLNARRRLPVVAPVAPALEHVIGVALVHDRRAEGAVVDESPAGQRYNLRGGGA
jgi:hypothetical protein